MLLLTSGDLTINCEKKAVVFSATGQNNHLSHLDNKSHPLILLRNTATLMLASVAAQSQHGNMLMENELTVSEEIVVCLSAFTASQIILMIFTVSEHKLVYPHLRPGSSARAQPAIRHKTEIGQDKFHTYNSPASHSDSYVYACSSLSVKAFCCQS